MDVKKHKDWYSFLIVSLIIPGISACGKLNSKSEPNAPVAPIVVSSDLTAIDLCSAIPIEDIEAIMGRKLVSAPEHFNYDIAGASGCRYDAGKNSTRDAFFGYVVLAPVDAYDQQPLSEKVEVRGIGESAYFNNAVDARQLWIKINDKVALMIGFGDRPNEAGASSIAKLVISALR